MIAQKKGKISASFALNEVIEKIKPILDGRDEVKKFREALPIMNLKKKKK